MSRYAVDLDRLDFSGAVNIERRYVLILSIAKQHVDSNAHSWTYICQTVRRRTAADGKYEVVEIGGGSAPSKIMRAMLARMILEGAGPPPTSPTSCFPSAAGLRRTVWQM